MFDCFGGHIVSVSVKSLKAIDLNNKLANVMLVGYLLDECQDYVYLGEDPKNITTAVKHNDIASVMLYNEGEMLTDIDVPEGAEFQ